MGDFKGAMAKLKAREAASKTKHREDVAYVQAHHPELSTVLTDFTKEFGRLNYRITLCIHGAPSILK